MADNSDKKECNLCGFVTDNKDDVFLFGDWMQRHDITVHYFCLLFSKNLPQNGRDANGILGFFLRDIRVEINKAKERKCIYCLKLRAGVCCYNCKKYYHMVCGRQYDCAFEFVDEFRSFCHKCAPLDTHQELLVKEPPLGAECYICTGSMLGYNPTFWIHARCCGGRFVHRLCIQKFALAAGYYLVCIWCRSKDFRDHVRLQGVFVPDRDAEWEKNNAFAELHRGHRRCDMEVCKCPKGRDYSRASWTITVCSLCGSFGAHIPACIPGSKRKKRKPDKFKCKVCCEATVHNTTLRETKDVDANHINHKNIEIDRSLLVTKKPATDFVEELVHETPQFSQIETSLFASTVMTEYNQQSSSQLNEVENTSSITQLVDEEKIDKLKTLTREDANAIVEPEDVVIDLSSPVLLSEQIMLSKEYSVEGTEEGAKNYSKSDKKNIVEERKASEKTDANTETNYLRIDQWTQLDDKLKCIGTCTERIDRNSQRFAGKSIDEICSNENMSQIRDEDSVERSSEIGKWGEINNNIIREIAGGTDFSGFQNKEAYMQQSTSKLSEVENTSLNTPLVDKDKINKLALTTEEPNTVVEPQEVAMDFRSPPVSLSKKKLLCSESDKENIIEEGKTSKNNDASTETDYIRIDQFPQLDDKFKCIGTCTVRINRNSPRFAGKTIDEICSPENMSLIRDEDIMERSTETGIWGEINKIIEKVAEGTDLSVFKNKKDYIQQSASKLSEVENTLFNTPLVDKDKMNKLALTTEDPNTVIEPQEVAMDFRSPLVSLSKKKLLCSESDKENIIEGKTSKNNDASTETDYIRIDQWPQLDDKFQCIGTCTVRINRNSPRFAGKTIDEICSPENMSLIRDEDIVERSTETEIWGEIDKIIEEVARGTDLSGFKNKKDYIQQSASKLSEVENTLFNTPLVDKHKMNKLALTTEEPNTVVEPQEVAIDFRSPPVSLSKKKLLCSKSDKQNIIEEGKTSKNNDASTETDFIRIDQWPQLDDKFQCIGTCTVRINRNSPRFAGKTIDEICSPENMSLIRDEDIVERSTETGIWREIDKIIDEIAGSNNSNGISKEIGN